MIQTPLKEVKRGALFKLKDSESALYWEKGDYVREERANKYSCIRTDDICHELLMKGSRIVFASEDDIKVTKLKQ